MPHSLPYKIIGSLKIFQTFATADDPHKPPRFSIAACSKERFYPHRHGIA